MISLGKTLFLTGTLTFVCAVANAAHKNDAYISQILNQHNGYMLFIPNLESEGKNTLQLEAKKIAYAHELPLLPRASSKKVIYKSCQTKKKNELYELSAIFNDKLQLFLSYIDNSKNYDVAEKQNTSNDLNVNSNIRIH
jgi:hypothetical protein